MRFPSFSQVNKLGNFWFFFLYAMVFPVFLFFFRCFRLVVLFQLRASLLFSLSMSYLLLPLSPHRLDLSFLTAHCGNHTNFLSRILLSISDLFSFSLRVVVDSGTCFLLHTEYRPWLRHDSLLDPSPPSSRFRTRLFSFSRKVTFLANGLPSSLAVVHPGLPIPPFPPDIVFPQSNFPFFFP